MKRRQTLGLVLLCLWSSVGWLTADLLPGKMPPLAGEGLRLLFIGLGAATLDRPGTARLWKVVVVGLGLFVIPSLLLNAAQGRSSASFGVIAFALVPVGIMIVQGNLARLPWGLAGAAGLLVILPVEVPSAARGWVGVGLVVAAAAVTVFGLVRLRPLLSGIRLASALAAISLSSGAVLLLMGLLGGPVGWEWSVVGNEMLRAALLDLPQLLLLLWLLREVTALRVSVRYLLAPLLTVLEGWVLVREGIGVRAVAGLVLLASGAYGLWREDDGEVALRLEL